MLKTLITVAVSLLLVVCAVSVFFAAWDESSVPAVRNAQNRGPLQAYVDRAKASGQSRAIKPAPIVEYVTDVKSLGNALKHYRLVVAHPREKRSLANERGEIWTWFKLQITESVTPKKYNPCADCPTPSHLPADLLPLGQDELLVAGRGGSVTVEDVEIVTPAEFDFQMSESYLLFLEEDQSGLFGRIMVGPAAVFRVNPDESLAPINEHPHSLKRIMKDQFKDSLKELRAAAKKQQ